jgi:AraC-like DNA-binding protein
MTSSTPDKCRLQQSFWDAVDRIGLRPTALLRQARLPVTLHLDTHQHITTTQFFALWMAMEALTGESDLWLKFVRGTEAIGHQPMFVAACYASDYRDGLARIARFKRFTMPERFDIDERHGEARIAKTWFYAPGAEPAMSVDVSFAFLLSLGRRGTGMPLTPLRIELTRDGPTTAGHEEFFGCPIRFGAPADVLIMRSSDLDRPFPGHNAELMEILTPALDEALGRFQPRSSFSERVKVALKRRLASGRPDISAVARDLGTSERTLQRRITEEGSTFRSLVQDSRRELGHKLLSADAADIAEVACLLGFQDVTSFYRAFRGWEGTTPQAWRRQNLLAAL